MFKEIIKHPARFIYILLHKRPYFSSKKYWQERYAKGGNAGPGSYGKYAHFKAEVINRFVEQNRISSAIEFGCGDGYQLSLFKIPKYTGLDVSQDTIERCLKMFPANPDKSFYIYEPGRFLNDHKSLNAELSLSLDVIFHLVEDEVFEKYMKDLFAAATKFVIIYASNTDKNDFAQSQHVRHREFTRWVGHNITGWKLIDTIKNPYPQKSIMEEGSPSDFYIYQKQ